MQDDGENNIDLSEVIINGATGVYDGMIKSGFKSGYDITGGNGRENSIVLHFEKKPIWFHRTCIRLFLGWKWNDIEKKEEKKLLLG